MGIFVFLETENFKSSFVLDFYLSLKNMEMEVS